MQIDRTADILFVLSEVYPDLTADEAEQVASTLLAFADHKDREQPPTARTYRRTADLGVACLDD